MDLFRKHTGAKPYLCRACGLYFSSLGHTKARGILFHFSFSDVLTKYSKISGPYFH